jgi:gas vesicle protein
VATAADDVQNAIAMAYNGAPQAPQDDVADAISQAYAPVGDAPKVTSTAPVSRTQSFAHGIANEEVSLGQMTEHIAETPLNWLRSGIHDALTKAGAPGVASRWFAPVSADLYDQLVRNREQDYQEARAQAGQTGIDWWNLAGQAANPINYMGGGPATTVAGRIGQAALQGAATSVASNPSTTPGSLWWDKAKDAVSGTVLGGAVGSLVEGVMPALKWGVQAIRDKFGSAAGAASPEAERLVNQTLNEAGQNPSNIDLNVLSGLKQEVQDAIAHGEEPSPQAVLNRARAESLPVPVRLMKGQATGDPMLYSREQNLRGITGVGEPITQRLQQQNSAFIANLDALGAKDAPDPVSTGSWLGEKIQGAWDQLDQRKDALYDKVRNSQGQPAMVDQFTAVKNIHDALDTPAASHAYDLLPTNIQTTLDDLESGKLPLSVAGVQALDKSWGADARAADGSTRYAIDTVRRFLNEAPVQDSLGVEAQQAYQAAKAAHAQQMALIDPKLLNGTPNPKFQPLVKAVVMDGKPPEQLYSFGFGNAAPSVASKNLQFVQLLDPNGAEMIGRTFMGEVKRQALSSASDERGTVSNGVLTGVANDPVKSARLDALMPQPAADTFRALASTVEAAKRAPVASTVNTSNTGSAVVNAGVSMLKTSVAAQIAKRVPIIKQAAEGLAAAKTQTQVQQALQPGVTLKSLLSATPSQAARRRLITRGLIPAADATDEDYRPVDNAPDFR